MKKLLLIFFVFTLVALSFTTRVQYDPSCHGQPLYQSLITDEPAFVKSVSNGKRYFVPKSKIHLIHLYGTPYEMGKAYGELMKDELRDQIYTYFAYLDKFIEKFMPRIPEFFAKMIIEAGLRIALDLNYYITKKYTPERYDQEFAGMEAGSGIPAVEFRRLNLLPELIKGACTIFGGWGDATVNGTLYQLRALDWDKYATITKHPAIIVYHPSEPGSHTFANIGFLGQVGTITGFSDASIGISQKVWLGSPDDITTRFGTPWMYVLRDILQFAGDTDSALTRLINADRTCAIFLGIGDSKTNEMRGIEYSYKELNVYDWSTQPTDKGNHPMLKDMVYWDKTIQPTSWPCTGKLLQQLHGKVDAAAIYQQIGPVSGTGDTQSVVMDYSRKLLYVAYAAFNPGPDEPLEAYKRPYTVFNMTKIFLEKL